MIKFLKYIRGYLRVRIWGFSPERFMNLCSNKGILLWDIVREGDVYYMNISLKGFWELRPVLRKTGTRVAVLERYGLPFFLPRLLKRKVFVLGFLLAIAFWTLSSLYIWDIELSGNYQITEDIFESFLKANAVTVGMRRDSLNIEELEKEIRRTFPQITWASAKLSGTKLLIEIKENDAPIVVERPESTSGTDLVAGYDGIIASMIVRSGVPKVAIGDTVEKGTILVEGKVPVYNEDQTVREYYYVDADADILLEHVVTFTESLPMEYIKKEYTGREKKSHYLKIGEKTYKLPETPPFLVYDSLMKESRPLALEKLSIPIFWGEVTNREYQNVEYNYSLEEAKILLNQKLIDFLTDLEEKGVQIIEKDVKIEKSDNAWVVTGNFLVREPVSESMETLKAEQEETDE
ncbi:sporulation protein YqfD [Acetatifactor muris]|uniref:Stage IV sporulation protein YqfD n=1 Tax=Acetatifactor muris TaxID=879566 RepID=A0A2K4ZJQ6_9FIRM|nr:sporulation protein YqfD [Acetatifactor muris]MCR2048981.1 sporulation protein YqfD [Acetatifactor muris]SOY30690.1 Putative stage IV sporulation protein YqfD [Acetatifactor muris]